MEAVKNLGLTKTKIYQASTSELFGKVLEVPQNEKTPFIPEVLMVPLNYTHIGL